MARAKLRVYAGALTSLMNSSWCGLTQSLYFATARTALALGRPLATGSGGGTEDAAAATAAAATDGVGWGSEVLSHSEQGVVSPPPQWEEGRWGERHTVKKRWRCQEIPCRGLKILQGVP